MAKTARSSRGTVVDFDLLIIQAQLASAPKPVNVEVREQLIDRKLRRRTKKLVEQTVARELTEHPTDLDTPDTTDPAGE